LALSLATGLQNNTCVALVTTLSCRIRQLFPPQRMLLWRCYGFRKHVFSWQYARVAPSIDPRAGTQSIFVTPCGGNRTQL